MKKMLMIASVASMIDQFNRDNISLLMKLGYEVHVASNFKIGNTTSDQRLCEFKNELDHMGVKYHQVDFSRNIFHLVSNYKAYSQIINLLHNNTYHFIHCQSPIGGVLGRLAAKREKIKVIYTAHGFHFYKKAPMLHWIIFYPIEKYLAKFTEVLITINKEDYTIAQKFGSKKVVYLPGIGIDTSKFNNHDNNRNELRRLLDISEDKIVLLSVGELSKRKNHEVIIKALAKLKNKKIVYIICGQGDHKNHLEGLARKLNVDLKLPGYQRDINNIFGISDIFVFPSLQEGLPVALMEAMSAGLPIICSKIRGNVDLIKEDVGGFLVEAKNVEGYAKAINRMINQGDLRNNMICHNNKIIKNFDYSIVNEKMNKIYKQL